ncbi:hypothetical protein PI125_g24813 [Phytophthora idaei]|nr:hypothetical protein PI125_g24813 [Phytophthora idaei]
MADFTRVDASEIQLYVAKEKGKWLPLSSDGAKALMVGEFCPSLELVGRQLSSMETLLRTCSQFT